jgi:hypothetical protein
MTSEEREKLLDEYNREKDVLEAKQHLMGMKASMTRGRSITAGTAFGGVTEISIRGDGQDLWVILQPSEVLEFIHQLAGVVGCHINIKPREDFGSWRGWKKSENERELEWGGVYAGGDHPPHPLLEVEKKVGLVMHPTQKETGETNETMATTKTINKRKSKRTTTPT